MTDLRLPGFTQVCPIFEYRLTSRSYGSCKYRTGRYRYTYARTWMYRQACVSDICALTFKGAFNWRESGMRLSVGEKERTWGRREEAAEPRANRFKLPSTSHSRFQLEACLFPFWVFRGLALYARAPPECNARDGGGGEGGVMREGGREEREKRDRESGLSVNYRTASQCLFLLFASFPSIKNLDNRFGILSFIPIYTIFWKRLCRGGGKKKTNYSERFLSPRTKSFDDMAP